MSYRFSAHALGLLLVLLSGCSSAPAPPPKEGRLAGELPPTLPPEGKVVDPHRVDRAPGGAGFGEPPSFRRVMSRRFGLSFPLPDRPGWALERGAKSRFLVMTHRSTDSQIIVRTWREEERMNRKRCEERARFWRPLPKRGRFISQRFVDLPAGFDTRIEAGFALSSSRPQERPIGGYVMAFGGRSRKCFAFVYSTRAKGEGAEALIGERLAVMQTGVFERIETRSLLP